jgi:hypothetical protein
MKFSYCQVLSELIYAYVVACLDIGYAVMLLARFSQSPAEEHYNALRGVCKYLCRTKSWGIIYWHDTHVPALPEIPLSTPPTVDSSLPAFPTAPLLQLTGFVDAAHATDLATRHSIMGLVFTLAGGAITYKSKLQPTVSTSSTEAEFIAAVHAAKIAKHLCHVLTELGYPPSAATPIYKDNQAAIAMINEDRSTTRSRHIDIQHFTIQEWRSRGESFACSTFQPPSTLQMPAPRLSAGFFTLVTFVVPWDTMASLNAPPLASPAVSLFFVPVSG